jgi:ClpP class serine protease
MKYAHILQAFYGEPWHLRPDYWRQYHVILQRAVEGQEVSPILHRGAGKKHLAFLNHGLETRSQTPLPIIGPTVTAEDGTVIPLVQQMEVFGSIALIPVQGVLGRHLSRLDLICGGVDYEHVTAFTALAGALPEVTDVVYLIDSPGGMSAGCLECASAIDQLMRAGKRKRTYTYTENVCCSAAYWLASRTADIIASPTAQVGNVGTILCGEDNSEQWGMEGRKLELFASSPLKATGTDGKAWTDEDRAYLRERMLQCDARIKAAVLSGRAGRIDPTSLDGRFFFAEIGAGAPGQSGLSVGMVDDIASCLDEVLAAIMLAAAAPAL